MYKRLTQTASSRSALDFRALTDLRSLVVRSDIELEGFSSAQLDLRDEDTVYNRISDRAEPQVVTALSQPKPDLFGRFYGELSLDLPPGRPEVVQSGFAMFRTRDIKPTLFNPLQSEFMNWQGMTGVQLRVRGDRRKYYVNVQAETPMVTDLYQHRLFLKTPGLWETVTVPISDFVLTNWGVIQQQEPMDRAHVRTVGIGLIDKQFGPFQLDVQWIRVVAGLAGSEDSVSQIAEDSTPGKKLSVDD